MTRTATSPQRKPVLDEASFQQLLSAAFVLQEHNDRLRGKEVHADFAKNLSAIVETQKLIQTLQLDLEAAGELVVERAQKITSASGAAIGILEKGQLYYRATTGSASMDQGTRVEPDSALSADCLSKGSALNYPDTAAESQVRTALFSERKVKAFIAVPVYHAGQIAGVLELRFTQANSFREADLRTAELMAGLLSEAMVTAARMKWKDALASERQSMLEALARIRPQLERLETESSTENAAVDSPLAPVERPAGSGNETSASPGADNCPVCGSSFFDEAESFCGICGTARPVESPSSDASGDDDQRKMDAPWLTPYEAENSAIGNSGAGAAPGENADARTNAWPVSLQELIELSAMQQEPAASFEKHLEKYETPKPEPPLAQAPLAPISAEPRPEPPVKNDFVPVSGGSLVSAGAASLTSGPFAPRAQSEAIATQNPNSLDVVPAEEASSEALQPYPWSSAKRAQQWLETVKVQQGPRAEWLAHQWQARRANIYVGLAILILLVVISGWGIRPATTTVAGNASPALNGQRQAPPEPNLTLFEKLLVNLGLAEAPPAPAYMGNPDTQVWVDVHTALYHCPGSDLYGKTPDGRMTTQRDAQQDQFEPANRKACP